MVVFGEICCTCLAVESDGYRILQSLGAPRAATMTILLIGDAALKATDAIVITHVHEDHVAANGRLIARFLPRIFMMPETLFGSGAQLGELRNC